MVVDSLQVLYEPIEIGDGDFIDGEFDGDQLVFTTSGNLNPHDTSVAVSQSVQQQSGPDQPQGGTKTFRYDS